MRRLGSTGKIEGQRGKSPINVWKTSKTGLTARFVCTNCNNGWMSQLEDRVKPIIESLISEGPIKLSRKDQMTLAAWAEKNAMVYETQRDQSTWFFEKTECTELRTSLQLPSQTSVWIAKYVGQNVIYCTASDLSGFAEVTGDPVKAYVTTMCFGSLAIQVLSSKFSISVSPTTSVTADMQPGPWDQVTLQIWPIQSEEVNWPSSMGLSGELGLQTFSDRWKSTKS